MHITPITSVADKHRGYNRIYINVDCCIKRINYTDVWNDRWKSWVDTLSSPVIIKYKSSVTTREVHTATFVVKMQLLLECIFWILLWNVLVRHIILFNSNSRDLFITEKIKRLRNTRASKRIDYKKYKSMYQWKSSEIIKYYITMTR